MSDAERWAALAHQLTQSGIDVKVDERDYPGGTSRSIFIRRPDHWTVEVADSWWSRNTDVWTGWGVYLSDTEGVVRYRKTSLKRRSDTTAAILEALAWTPESASRVSR